MGNNRGHGWRVALALTGVVMLLVAYYWVHKPFDPALLLSLGGALLDLLTVALIVTAAGGLGRRVLAWILNVKSRRDIRLNASGEAETRPQFEPIRLSKAEQVATAGSLGLGMMAWSALALGAVGAYTQAAFWLTLLVIGGVNLPWVLEWLGDVRYLLRRIRQPENGWIRFLVLLVGLLLFLALLCALAPPTAFDALNYHLVGPQRYLRTGQITAQADNHFLGLPQGAEVAYGMAMGLLGRDTAAAPLHFVFGVLGLLAVGGVTRRYAGAMAGWLAVTLVMSAYSVWLLFGWAYVDLAVLAYSAVAFTAVMAWRGVSRTSGMEGQRWLIVMGLIAGMALGVKYTAIGLLLALAVGVLVTAPRQIIRNGLTLAIPALLAFMPWLLKGLLLYQNPVYPFVFGGLNWDDLRAYTFNTPGTGLLNSPYVWMLPVLPLAATVFGIEKADAVGFIFSVGPWLLTAPLFLLIGWRYLEDRARELACAGLLLGLPLLLFWMVLAAASSIGIQTRLMALALPVAAVLGVLGFYSLSRWPRKPVDVYFIVRAALAITLLLGAVESVRETARAKVVPYLLATLSREAYLTDTLGIYINAMRRLDDLPDGSQVRLLFEPKTYYCPGPITCIPDILFDHWFRPLRQGQTPDEVFAAWQSSGDDYLLVFDLGYEFNATDERFKDENALFPDALQKWMKPVWNDGVGGYSLYTWK